MAEVEPGLYRHYKGGLYTVLLTATMERSAEEIVCYQGSDGRVWARPVWEFWETITKEGEHYAKTRFTAMLPHADCPQCGGTGQITDKRYTFAGRGCECWKVLPKAPEGMEFVPGTMQTYVRTIGLETQNGRHRE